MPVFRAFSHIACQHNTVPSSGTSAKRVSVRHVLAGYGFHLLVFWSGIVFSPWAISEADTTAEETFFTPFVAVYRTREDGFFSIPRQATRSLERLPDGSWLYRLYAKSTGVELSEYTHFQLISVNGRKALQPLNYVYTLSGWAVRSRVANLNFNHQTLTVLNNVENQPWQMSIPEGTQDKLSVLLQLRLDLAAGMKRMEYAVADGGRLKHYVFDVVGEEVVPVGNRSVRSIKVRKTKVPSDDRSALLWLDPARRYLLVRMKQVAQDHSASEAFLDSWQGQ